MLMVHENVIYKVGWLKSGYYILRLPPDGEAELIQSHLTSEKDAINYITKEIKHEH